jgi:predicted transcriptional regulator
LPDHLFHDAGRLARRLKKSKSRVYREAIQEYVARHDPDEVTAKLDVVVDELSLARDPFLAPAARRTLERVEW